MLGVLGHRVDRAEVEARPAHHVRWLASEADATVLLKGPITLVADPAGVIYSQDTGPSWLATAGSGDVLAGIAGALMATGVPAQQAGAMAAHVHGRAGARASAGGPISAMWIADEIPATIAAILASDRRRTTRA
jgi:NAD(P)H-hydrate repair Nnr-like enzyme with NAD(P)H-hydrate dehydratase domain